MTASNFQWLFNYRQVAFLRAMASDSAFFHDELLLKQQMFLVTMLRNVEEKKVNSYTSEQRDILNEIRTIWVNYKRFSEII